MDLLPFDIRPSDDLIFSQGAAFAGLLAALVSDMFCLFKLPIPNHPSLVGTATLIPRLPD